MLRRYPLTSHKNFTPSLYLLLRTYCLHIAFFTQAHSENNDIRMCKRIKTYQSKKLVPVLLRPDIMGSEY